MYPNKIKSNNIYIYFILVWEHNYNIVQPQSLLWLTIVSGRDHVYVPVFDFQCSVRELCRGTQHKMMEGVRSGSGCNNSLELKRRGRGV